MKISLKIFVLFFLVVFFSKYSISNASFIGVSPTVVATSTCSVGLSCGLVGYWTFDGKDMVNGVVLDKSGNNNRGNLINISTSTFYAPGKIGQGFNFDGSNDYMVKTGFDYGDTSANEGTAAFWVRLKTRNDASFGGFLSSSNLAPNFYQSSGTMNCRVDNTLSAGTVIVSDSIPLNKWVHYVCVWNTTGGYLYEDGNLVSSDLTVVTPYKTVQGDSVYIGSDRLLSNRYTNADIDDVRIYNRALSASEISQLYSSGVSTKQGSSQTVTATSTCSVGLSCGLVGYWTFDGKDMVRGVARDVSGSGNHANLINISTSTFYTLGKIGQGFNFDFSNDRVNLSTNILANRTSFSIMMWARKNKSATGSLFSSASGGPYWRVTSVGGDTLFYIEKSDCTSGVSRNTVLLNDDKFHLVGITMDSTGAFKIFKDGVQVDSSSYPSWDYVCADATDWASIGNYATSFPFGGVIDDVRIYNRALSASEVYQLYSSGASTKQGSSQTVTATSTCSMGLSCGLVGYWTFDGKDMVRGVAQDKSGNNNKGILENISTSTFYTLGKISQGFNLDGVDDAVRASDSSSLDISDTQSVTQSAWIYSTSFAGHPQVIEKRGNYELRVNTTGNVDTTKYYSNTTRCRRTATNPISLYKWYHIVSVAVNTDCPEIYINGILQSSSGTPEVANYEVIQPLGIGNRSVVNTQQWVGKLDDIRIYNRALSANEIRQLYNMGK